MVMKMIDNLLLNKKNTVIYQGDEILSSVSDFNIKVTSDSSALYEMLSSEPVYITGENVKYEITLKQYADDFIDTADGFNLKFKLPHKTVTFTNCKTIGGETRCDNKGNIILIRTIHGERMS